MESVEQVADAEGMLSEVSSAADSMIYRLDVCFEHYPEFLKNPKIRQKVVGLLQKAKDYIVKLKENLPMIKLVHHEMVINSKFLEVPRSYYQRNLNANRVKRIAAEFDERIANARRSATGTVTTMFSMVSTPSPPASC